MSIYSFLLFASFSFASPDGTYNDSHPQLCLKLRQEAQSQCKGDNSCYVALLSNLIDRHNSKPPSEDPAEDLYCNY
jgi:hypothetical protein